MKKSLLLTGIVMASITASGADITKEAYLTSKKASAERSGTAYDEARAMIYFNKVDTNQDGVMSDAEVAAYRAGQAAPAAPPAPTAPAVPAVPAEPKK